VVKEYVRREVYLIIHVKPKEKTRRIMEWECTKPIIPLVVTLRERNGVVDNMKCTKNICRITTPSK
jgi:hypothetical protein